MKEYPVTEFEFLGYSFRRVFIKDRLGRLQFNFLPSVSVKSAKTFRDKIKAMRIHSYTGSKIEIIAEMLSPMVRGWLNYFTKFNPSAVKYTMDCLNRRLVKWAMCKYKRFRGKMAERTCKKRTQYASTLGSRNDTVAGRMIRAL
ncbi:group II intron maturase-specific domain-containing protein [Fontibacillus panacisegetis]|uniref:group II intron maturase-specific domain-containing protein n=1 Tax=Fontibacillus solani TaxID=1572857 RepID=UPI001C726240|nr:group II intron maturase-specific domain-containing protein [Fontibacillus solani]